MLACATCVCFCCALEKGVENKAAANAALLKHNRMLRFIGLPHVRETSRSPSGSRGRVSSRLYADVPLLGWLEHRKRFPERRILFNATTRTFERAASELPPRKSNTIRSGKFRARDKFSRECSIRACTSLLVPPFEFPGSPNKFFDLTLARIPMIIMRTSLLWRADKRAHWEIPNAGCMDGAKIYFCYRRCCFLTWKGSCSFLYRLSPRKSRFQSHPTEMRSVPERRSRYDESVSAR